MNCKSCKKEIHKFFVDKQGKIRASMRLHQIQTTSEDGIETITLCPTCYDKKVVKHWNKIKKEIGD